MGRMKDRFQEESDRDGGMPDDTDADSPGSPFTLAPDAGDPDVTIGTCPACGGANARIRPRPDTIHDRELRCPDCHHFRWLPKPRPEPEPDPKGPPPMSSPWDVEASNSGGSSEVPPEGNHPAIFIALVDLGTHEDEYQGKKYENRKALLCWELSGEFDSAGKPYVVSQDVALMPKISGKSKLRKILEQWRSKPLADGERINLASLLGKPCLINIGHGKSSKGNAFAKIQSIGPLVRGMQAPRPFHEPYSWYYGEGPLRIPDWIPWLYGESIEDVIGRCKELGRMGAGGAPAGTAAVGAGVNGSAAEEDPIPF